MGAGKVAPAPVASWAMAVMETTEPITAAKRGLERKFFMKGTLGSGHTERGLFNPWLQFTSAL
jgi:hypothetical protein